MRYSSPVLFLTCFLTGCTNLLHIPPAHVGDQILGEIELSFEAPVGPGGAETRVTVTADLHSRTWPGLRSQGTIHYLVYVLEENQLTLRLDDELRVSMQGGMMVEYDERGNMIGHYDPTRNRRERSVLVLEGAFEFRDAESIGGSLTGTIREEIVRETYERRTQRLVESSNVRWRREVSGSLLKDGKPADRLSIRRRR